MDLHDLENEIQRLVGYDSIVTSGIASRGPHLDFNAGRRLLRIWIPRNGVDNKKIVDLVKGYLKDPNEAAFKEIDYESA
jgi:hypothetical protein